MSMLTPDFTYVHTVTAQRFLGRGISGDEYGEAETYRCRVNLKRTLYSGNHADELVAKGTIFFSAGVHFEPQDQITFQGNTYRVVESRICYDMFGNENHIEVTVK